MYLTEAEFETLAIDEFSGQLAGLTLAEVDLGVAGSMPESLPIEVANEVTNDERFTGGALANMTGDDLRQLIVVHQTQ